MTIFSSPWLLLTPTDIDKVFQPNMSSLLCLYVSIHTEKVKIEVPAFLYLLEKLGM